MLPFTTANRPRSRRQTAGFSLIELMAVIAIIAIMVSLLAPAIGSFSSSAGRKGAVNILMNTLEQARSAALEQNCPVNVLLWRREFPNRDAIMVVRDPSPWIQDDSGHPETNVVPLTKWINLPEGILLHKPAAGANVFNNKASDVFSSSDLEQLPKSGGTLPQDDYLATIKFNASGAIVSPSDSADARIIITEGVRGAGGTEALLSQKKQSQSSGGGFDVITLSRFTGRARLDVTTL